jgi:hypothetical protein
MARSGAKLKAQCGTAIVLVLRPRSLDAGLISRTTGEDEHEAMAIEFFALKALLQCLAHEGRGFCLTAR